MTVQRLGPGSGTPAWVDALDRVAFGDVWGPVGAHETLWLLEPHAFARWVLLPAAGEAELVRIAVDPSCRGQGLARRLLAHTQELLVREGYGELHLEVRVGNHPARKLYEYCGWTFLGIRPAYYRDGEDAARYVRQDSRRSALGR